MRSRSPPTATTRTWKARDMGMGFLSGDDDVTRPSNSNAGEIVQ